MQYLLIAASFILLLTAVAHSILGEIMIFRKLSDGRVVPSMSAPPLKERNVRILWASWHLTSIFGLVFALAVFKVGVGAPLSVHELICSIAIACFAGGMLVLLGTKGRHPGWISLSLASALIWYAYKAAI